MDEYDKEEFKNKDETDEFIDIETEYFKEINKIPLLSSSEEKDLAYKMSQGDLKAREKLINSNLRFVVSIARNYKNSSISFLDLIEAGNEGLITAIDRFDPSRECKICTYAKYMIKKYIIEFIKENARSIKMPKSVLENIKKYNNTKEKLMIKLSREPNRKEMAAAMNLSESSIQDIEYQIYKQNISSLNSLVDEEQNGEFIDFIPSDEKTPEEILTDLDLKHQLVDLLLNKCNLTSRQIEVTMLYYGLNDGHFRKESDIAKICNITIERVRQILLISLHKIRESQYTEKFAIYTSNPDKSLENSNKKR